MVEGIRVKLGSRGGPPGIQGASWAGRTFGISGLRCAGAKAGPGCAEEIAVRRGARGIASGFTGGGGGVGVVEEGGGGGRQILLVLGGLLVSDTNRCLSPSGLGDSGEAPEPRWTLRDSGVYGAGRALEDSGAAEWRGEGRTGGWGDRGLSRSLGDRLRARGCGRCGRRRGRGRGRRWWRRPCGPFLFGRAVGVGHQ